MKTTPLLVITISLFLTSFNAIASPILLPAWQSDAPLQNPESVVYDAKRNQLYVSNVNGDGMVKDGNGYISTLSLDGKLIKQHWLTGLDAPKGMAIVGDTLYVADINEVVEIDLKAQAISQRYSAENAAFLNDIAAASDGSVYISDMIINAIYRIKDGKITTWLTDPQLESPNGLLVENDQLIVASWGNITSGLDTEIPGHLKTISLENKQIQSLGNHSSVGNLDGLESDGKGAYLVTDWVAGELLYITPQGLSSTLLKLERGSADHTVLLKQGLIIIPMMLSDTIVAYRIK